MAGSRNDLARLPRALAILAALLLIADIAHAAEIKVLSSGGFRSAYLNLVPEFERATGHKVATTAGGSMGDSPTTIPNRLKRGEAYDVVILAAEGLDDLIRQGLVVPASRVDLARSGIGVAVRAGAARPDLSTTDTFKRALVQAKSIAYSTSASGVYLIGLFQRLGIADRMKLISKQVSGEPVGAVVARGEAEIGFQQVSELLPVKGIDYVGPLPPEIQEITVFSAGVPANAPTPDAGRTLIEFLSSAAAAPVIRKTGMEPR
jgi:molybdate transport system substrate-binding protein